MPGVLASSLDIALDRTVNANSRSPFARPPESESVASSGEVARPQPSAEGVPASQAAVSQPVVSQPAISEPVVSSGVVPTDLTATQRTFEPAKSAARLGRRQLCPSCGLRFGDTARYCPFDGAELSGDETPRRDEWIGTVLSGRYIIDRFLGEGQMGEVYQVTHQQLGRVFAVKILKESFTTQPGLGGRFLREARAAARVEHPNAVRVTDFGTHEGRPFFVMELLPGVSLRRLIERGPLDPRRAALIVRQVAEALCAAHGAGVVHRDLRPESILVDANDGDRVRVLDFGMARILDEPSITEPGRIWTTPEYVSPEQAAGGSVDPRSDQYALGVLFYELLTGRPPFQGTLDELLSKHMYQKPVAPSDRLPGVDVGMYEPIVLRCLEKRPAARFESVERLLAYLDRAIGRRSRRKSRRGRVDSVPTAPVSARRGSSEHWLSRAAHWLSDAWTGPKKH